MHEHEHRSPMFIHLAFLPSERLGHDLAMYERPCDDWAAGLATFTKSMGESPHKNVFGQVGSQVLKALAGNLT